MSIYKNLQVTFVLSLKYSFHDRLVQLNFFELNDYFVEELCHYMLILIKIEVEDLMELNNAQEKMHDDDIVVVVVVAVVAVVVDVDYADYNDDKMMRKNMAKIL